MTGAKAVRAGGEAELVVPNAARGRVTPRTRRVVQVAQARADLFAALIFGAHLVGDAEAIVVGFTRRAKLALATDAALDAVRCAAIRLAVADLIDGHAARIHRLPAKITGVRAGGARDHAAGVALRAVVVVATVDAAKSVEITHAPPGTKGIHIHQTADCSDIPNKSMGEHFSPEGRQHGLPTAPEHHLGDLGNIEIDADGTGVLEMTIARANLKPGDPLSFVGKAIVVHAKEDVGTPPSGDSGTPIACAPIAAG